MKNDTFIDDEGILWTSDQLAKIVKSFAAAPQSELSPPGYVYTPTWLVEIMQRVIPPEDGDIVARERK